MSAGVPTVILDFDGTVAVGHGPVLAFADAVSQAATDPAVAIAAHRALVEFESGGSDHRDGYAAVTSAALAFGLTSTDINAAYLRSRELLGTDRAPVDVAAGLGDFLERMATVAKVWLATNAPDTGIARVLGAAGLDRRFDRTCFEVGKPDGLTPLLAEALDIGPVLSVGDVYDFDLAPAVELGAATGLVGPRADRDPRPVSMRAASLDALFPDIEAWVASAARNGVASPEASPPDRKEP